MSNSPRNQNQEIQEAVLQEHVVTVPELAEHDEEWLKTAKEKIKQVPKLLNNTSGRSTCSIFRVPQNLMKIHRNAFEPHIVSIGPYYHGKEHLQMIQEHKWRLLGVVLARSQVYNFGLGDIYKAIAVKEKKIRECYSESIEGYNGHELIEMMVLDGCFILELICIVGSLIPNELNDPIFMPRWILYSLSRDFLKLENQIPFFVLQTLFELQPWNSRKGNTSLTELILEFFHYSIQINDEIDSDRFKNLEGEHLLDLFRKRFIPSNHQENQIKKENQENEVDKRFHHSIRPVEKLRAAGIIFKKSEIGESFLDIRFKPSGVLEIPSTSTGSLTRSFLLNCVAFEQCYRFCSTHFTSYVVFMSCLINTPCDAGHLLDRRVFENSGTDEEVVKFFSELKDDVFIDIKKSYLAKVIDDVNEYYSDVWHVRWAEFKYNYFGSPWIFLSALAALILLGLTVIQAFFAVYGYLNPLK